MLWCRSRFAAKLVQGALEWLIAVIATSSIRYANHSPMNGSFSSIPRLICNYFILISAFSLKTKLISNCNSIKSFNSKINFIQFKLKINFKKFSSLSYILTPKHAFLLMMTRSVAAPISFGFIDILQQIKFREVTSARVYCLRECAEDLELRWLLLRRLRIEKKLIIVLEIIFLIQRQSH